MNTKLNDFRTTLLALLLAFHWGYAQELDVNEIKIELSKEAQKAQKKQKSTFTDLGIYWNEDHTQLHKVFVYQIKEDPMMYEIITVDENGDLVSQENAELTADALKKYNLELDETLVKNEGPDVSNQQYGFFRRSTLAGSPTLNVGHFEHRFYRGVWYGYDFEEDEDFKLEERFWPDFSFAVKGTNLDNNSSHLLWKKTSLGRVFQGQRNYIPMEGKAVLGGLMATSEQNKYLTGIYDLAKRDWEAKYENQIDSKILQTGGSVEKTDQQGAYSLLVCEKGYLLLDIDSQGRIIHQNWLDLENNQKKGVPENWEMQITEDGGVFLFHPIADGYSTKKMDLALFEVKAGQVLNQSYISYEQQDEKLQQAPKSKVNYKQVTGFMVDKILELDDGDITVLAHTHKPDVLNVIFHLNPDLSLNHLFTIDAVPHIQEKATEAAFAGFIPGELYPAGDGQYYWITRDIPGRLLPGIHTSRSTSGEGTGVITTTTTTARIDEVYAYFKVAKLNLDQGTISKPFFPEKMLAVGSNPGEFSKSGYLFMNLLGDKTGTYYNLIIQ